MSVFAIQNDTWLVGHPGYGGQNVKFDVRHQLAFAYVSGGPELMARPHNNDRVTIAVS